MRETLGQRDLGGVVPGLAQWRHGRVDRRVVLRVRPDRLAYGLRRRVASVRDANAARRQGGLLRCAEIADLCDEQRAISGVSNFETVLSQQRIIDVVET